MTRIARCLVRPAGLLLGVLAMLPSVLTGVAVGDDPGAPASMRLGAVTHFEQGWQLSQLARARDIGVTAIRDELSWSRVEREPGVYRFDDPRVAYIDALGSDLPVTIVFTYPNELYDEGATPYTDAGRAAFARFIVATLDRFPNIAAVEVGNEFNAQNFVFGPIREAPYTERPAYYAALLKAVHEAVKARHPHITVLGGAAHSIPVGYFRQLFALDALAHMDGIVIHPYSSEPERVCRHIGMLDAAMGERRVPIFVTEFGSAGHGRMRAADYLVKMATALASCDVAAADWYALQEEAHFPGMGLVEADGSLLPAGRAFRLMRTLLRAGNPEETRPDATSYVYRFGPNAMVLWGEPREIVLGPSVAAYEATGAPLPTDGLALDPMRPVVLIAAEPLALGDNVVLGPQPLVADSYHQFEPTEQPGGAGAREWPWSYYALSGTGQLQTLATEDGGTISSEPWHPYVGNPWRRPLYVTAHAVNPVDFAGGADPAKSYAVVERYTSPTRQTVRIEGHWDVSDGSEDGVTVRITVDGRVVYDAQARDEIAVELPDVALSEGSTVDFIVGPGGSAAGGDATRRRIRLYAAGRD